jgi:16S rRNA (adenine1518-N6/adenine1519-N6)-dimethyltransferase
MTHTLSELTALLDSHGITLSRALGQNYVADPNTVRRIARLAEVGPDSDVIEIGAGVGSLTLALVETRAQVTAIELDRRIVTVLRDVVEPLGVTVIEGDAMQLDWATLLAGRRVSLVANLPYNIATPLICDLLDGVPEVVEMLVMVQREVGERLAARVGDTAYGAVSVKVSYWGEAKVVGIVSPTVFVPRPKVDSALVRIRRHDEGPAVPGTAVSADRLFSVVRAGFGQRRKMLRRSLAGVASAEAFTAAGVNPEARPEELDVHAWGRLAAAISQGTTPPIDERA